MHIKNCLGKSTSCRCLLCWELTNILGLEKWNIKIRIQLLPSKFMDDWLLWAYFIRTINNRAKQKSLLHKFEPPSWSRDYDVTSIANCVAHFGHVYIIFVFQPSFYNNNHSNSCIISKNTSNSPVLFDSCIVSVQALSRFEVTILYWFYDFLVRT